MNKIIQIGVLCCCILLQSVGAGVSPEQGEELVNETRQKNEIKDKLLAQAGLSEEQQKKIRTFREERRTEINALRKNLQQQMQRLKKIESDSEASEAEIDQVIDDLAAVQADLIRVHVKGKRQMRKILGEEKTKQILEKMSERVRRGRKRNKFHQKGAGSRGQGREDRKRWF